MARTPSGIIVPSKEGSAIAIIATQLPAEIMRKALEDFDGRIEPGQACVVMGIDEFLIAAADV